MAQQAVPARERVRGVVPEVRAAPARRCPVSKSLPLTVQSVATIHRLESVTIAGGLTPFGGDPDNFGFP